MNMSGINIVERFRCEICATVHADRCDAAACWRECNDAEPDIQIIWTCPDCADEFISEEEAMDCCSAHRNDPPRLPSAAELEAAGQIRLL
ncbi:MAG: hypothetical protein SGI92_31395 [Bryobacteraceae bacterium]|nr:hypothetical protein [Bryobacteraceae bacterium]